MSPILYVLLTRTTLATKEPRDVNPLVQPFGYQLGLVSVFTQSQMETVCVLCPAGFDVPTRQRGNIVLLQPPITISSVTRMTSRIIRIGQTTTV